MAPGMGQWLPSLQTTLALNCKPATNGETLFKDPGGTELEAVLLLDDLVGKVQSIRHLVDLFKPGIPSNRLGACSVDNRQEVSRHVARDPTMSHEAHLGNRMALFGVARFVRDLLVSTLSTRSLLPQWANVIFVPMASTLAS